MHHLATSLAATAPAHTSTTDRVSEICRSPRIGGAASDAIAAPVSLLRANALVLGLVALTEEHGLAIETIIPGERLVIAPYDHGRVAMALSLAVGEAVSEAAAHVGATQQDDGAVTRARANRFAQAIDRLFRETSLAVVLGPTSHGMRFVRGSAADTRKTLASARLGDVVCPSDARPVA